MTTSRGNRDALALLVHSEVDRALGRLGLATADEVRQLTSRLKAAEAKLREIDAPSPTVAPAPTGVTSATPPAKRPATKKPTVAKATRAKANGTKA